MSPSRNFTGRIFLSKNFYLIIKGFDIFIID